LSEVEDVEFLVEAASRNAGWRGLLWEGDGFDNVSVLQGVEAFTGVGVPDFARIGQQRETLTKCSEVSSRCEVG
jgi:hypothetical protein